jgi:hypothetical protein
MNQDIQNMKQECHIPVAQLGLFTTQDEQHIKFATPDINYEF